MKPVLLIYPPYEGRFFVKSRQPYPTGLVYIASYLRRKGISAHVMDFGHPPHKIKAEKPPLLKNVPGGYWRYGQSDPNIMHVLKNELFNFNEIVGVSSLMSSNYVGAYNVIRMIKQIDPTRKVVIGGPHATVFPDHVLKNSLADYICIGEGEEAFYNFVSGKSTDFEGINFVKDLDTLAFPDPSVIINRSIDSYREMVVTFSRGCPHKCSFCGSHLIQGRIWRYKSVDVVMGELSTYVSQYGIKHFVVEDDNLCPGTKGIARLKVLCKRIIKELSGLRFTVPHGIPVYATADAELCDLIHRAGFRKMVFPLESSDPEVLKDMNKEFTPSNYIVATKNWSQYERKFPTEIIIGYPFVDTIETMLKTMIFIADNGGIIWPSHFRLNKNTPLFERCVRAGYVTKNFDPILTQEFSIATERFSIKDCKELIKIAKGINFGTEVGIKVFTDFAHSVLKCSGYSLNLGNEPKEGDVVAEGSFAFRKGQDMLSAVVLALKFKMKGMPIIRYRGNNKLYYKGMQSSNVFRVLSDIVKDKKRTKLEF